MEEINVPNPYIEPHDYYKQLNDNIQNLKNDPNVVAFDKLCFEVFETEFGKKFLEYVRQVFFIASFPGVSKGSATYQEDLIYVDGYRDAYRKIMQSIQSHQQRIKSEMDNARRNNPS